VSESALVSRLPADAQETRDPPAPEFLERRFVISNRLGLHARAAVKLVKTANRFRSDICVCAHGMQVNGKSVMGLLTLAASQRAALLVTCEGDDAGAAMEAVAAVIEAGFGEK
jgi:phosphocarrier protein HPr